MAHLKSETERTLSRLENFIYTNFGMTLEPHANTVITDHEFF